jgi:hypothetical protein
VHFFSWLVTLITGSRITDVSTATGDPGRCPTPVKLDQDQFWTSELLISMRLRLRILEVPITIRAAPAKSKKPKTFKYAWHFTKAIFKTWLDSPPCGVRIAGRLAVERSFVCAASSLRASRWRRHRPPPATPRTHSCICASRSRPPRRRMWG